MHFVDQGFYATAYSAGGRCPSESAYLPPRQARPSLRYRDRPRVKSSCGPPMRYPNAESVQVKSRADCKRVRIEQNLVSVKTGGRRPGRTAREPGIHRAGRVADRESNRARQSRSGRAAERKSIRASHPGSRTGTARPGWHAPRTAQSLRPARPMSHRAAKTSLAHTRISLQTPVSLRPLKNSGSAGRPAGPMQRLEWTAASDLAAPRPLPRYQRLLLSASDR